MLRSFDCGLVQFEFIHERETVIDNRFRAILRVELLMSP